MANLISKKARNRREFLRQCAAISLLGSGAGAMNGKLGLIGSAMAASSDYAGFDDYKALVCVFLYGGSDSFSMFVPTDEGAYANYKASRGEDLAVPYDDLLKGDTDTGIGFNPLLNDLHGLYNKTSADPGARLAVFSNVGNLIAPLSRSQFIAVSNVVPNDLFAHNHQQEQWLKGLSSSPAAVVGSGWGGRMADLLQHANNSSGLPPSYSVAGSNYWLPGQEVQPISLSPSYGLSPLQYLDGVAGSSNSVARGNTLDAMLGLSTDHPLKQTVAASLAHAKAGAADLKATLQGTTNLPGTFDTGSKLAKQLRMVARLIAGNYQSGSTRRQIFFVGAGGWDTHDNQTPRMNALMADLNRSMIDFQNTLDQINVTDSVTTFTASDFGRTLTINGDGSDHGWGGHYMVMGGAVNQGRMLGRMPDLAVGSDDDTGDKGRIIPSLSINQYGALMARWMGVTDSDLNGIFPDLANFGSAWDDGLNVFS